MSSNTNTLFWVITGAVIIVAVFLLVNNSSSNTLQGVSDKFSNITAEGGINSNLKDKYKLSPVDPDKNYIPVDVCGVNRVYIEGYIIEMYDFYYQEGDGSHARWFIINNSKTMLNKKATIYVYECGTNKLITDLNWNVSQIKPGNYSQISSWSAGYHNNLKGYYIKAKLQ